MKDGKPRSGTPSNELNEAHRHADTKNGRGGEDEGGVASDDREE